MIPKYFHLSTSLSWRSSIKIAGGATLDACFRTNHITLYLLTFSLILLDEIKLNVDQNLMSQFSVDQNTIVP